MPILLPRENILDHKMSKEYTAYVKRHDVAKYKRALGRKELFLIVRVLLKHVAKNIVERTGGVFIRNLGYFFVWKIPRRMLYQRRTKGKKIEEHFNYITDHHMYSPIFMSSGGNSNLRSWLMDNKFSENVKKGIQARINSGFKYRMYPFSLKKLLQR